MSKVIMVKTDAYLSISQQEKEPKQRKKRHRRWYVAYHILHFLRDFTG